MIPKLIVFDWDGTLADSTALIASALQGAAADLGFPVPSDHDARYIIGLGLKDALLHAIPSCDEARYPELALAYRKHFLAGEHTIRLFDGVPEMLRLLDARGAWLAVATGKSRRGLDRAFEQLDLRRYFVASRCADEGRPKPDPDMLHYLMRHTGTRPDELLMIGDTIHDLDLATNAGVRAIACTYGAHDSAALIAREPFKVVASIATLQATLMTLLEAKND